VTAKAAPSLDVLSGRCFELGLVAAAEWAGGDPASIRPLRWHRTSAGRADRSVGTAQPPVGLDRAGLRVARGMDAERRGASR
jgi:hypothetical protein